MGLFVDCVGARQPGLASGPQLMGWGGALPVMPWVWVRAAPQQLHRLRQLPPPAAIWPHMSPHQWVGARPAAAAATTTSARPRRHPPAAGIAAPPAGAAAAAGLLGTVAALPGVDALRGSAAAASTAPVGGWRRAPVSMPRGGGGEVGEGLGGVGGGVRAPWVALSQREWQTWAWWLVQACRRVWWWQDGRREMSRGDVDRPMAQGAPRDVGGGAARGVGGWRKEKGPSTLRQWPWRSAPADPRLALAPAGAGSAAAAARLRRMRCWVVGRA